MRIGVVCPYDLAVPGGVQQLCLELTERLRAAGEDVVLIAAGLSDSSGGSGVAVGRSVRVPGNRSRAPITIAPGSWRRVTTAAEAVDVLHIHEPLMPLVGWAALATSLPTVATFHADPPRWARTLYRRVPWVERALRSTSITAVSEVAASALPTRWGEAVVVPNAIDVDAYDIHVERNPRQVVFLGRDEPRKGLDHLLRAWPRIVEAVPDARLVVMGAKRSQPLPGVTFLGSVAAPVKNETLASSGVFVAPNTSGESFGIVVAEAMAAGCAIVASDLPGFAAVLGTAGRLVSPGDPAAIASAVVSLLDQPDLARAFGERARTEVRRFDWPVVLGAYRQLYAAVRGI